MEGKMMTSAQAIVECIRREGIPNVFCVPGESYLPVMDAISDEPTIELISARHEGGAAFMAEGYAKASGKTGVVMGTRGVGASNLTIGVHTAYQDSTPLVVLLGQVHSSFSGREGFQEVDLEAFFRPIAKWVAEIREPPRVPEILQRAFRIAQTGRPGPVVLSLPEDLLKKQAPMTFGPALTKPAPRPNLRELEGLEKFLQHSDRPLIIAGGGVKGAGAEKALQVFAEKFEIPVMCAFRRHDAFPNDDARYVGHLGLGVHPNIIETVREADTILAIGTRLSEVTTQDYTLLQANQNLIHIDVDYGTLGKVYAPNIGIIADANETLRSMMDFEMPLRWKEWGATRRRAYEATLQVPGKATVNGRIISMMQKHLPSDTVFTNDAGNFAGWLHSFFQFRQKHTYVGPTSGAMGYGMPAALGVKLAHPDKTVVSLSGDGGFMMTMQEFETAVRYQIPVISIVFNNRMYGTIRMHQEIHYPYKKIGTDLGEVPFSKLAEDLGAAGFHVKTPEQFEEALTAALKEKKPVLIEVESERDQISVSSTIQQMRQRTK
ncbi:thiamine pyrophosphate-dependent enzyme [Halobacillus litoralis]|uniref:thiamine pyrophosphate-dependent enzyme n=1 Tax=Halobacillus litoralis TaxID=45668 RepID=UPI0024926B7B|nr:thiamine pyrophosphate-dependent enzyme [Halobacillus litoralis]